MRALAALSLLLLACQGRQPESLLRFPGRVVTQGGTPLAGVTVVASLYPCFPVELPEAQSGLTEVITDSAGEYEVSVFQFQRENECLNISMRDDVTGAGAEMSIGPRELPRRLPDLVLWTDPVRRFEVEGVTHHEVPVPRWSSEVGFDPALHWLQWTLTQGDQLVWSELAREPFVRSAPDLPPGESFIVTPMHLQDFGGGGVLRGLVSLTSSVVGQYMFSLGGVSEPQAAFVYRAWTPGLQVEGPGLLPPSRGAACSVRGVEQQPCPLTDGALTRNPLVAPAEDGLALVEFFRLDFGASLLPRFVVRHGGRYPLQRIEVSSDGETWTAAARDTRCNESYCLLPLWDSTPEARYLRVLIQEGTGQELPAEFSVFE